MAIVPTAPKFGFPTARDRAARRINRWGRDSVIRRNGRADIPVRTVVLTYVIAREGEEVDPNTRTVLISPVDQNGNPVAEPDPDKDMLVLWKVDQNTGLTVVPNTVEEILPIVERPDRIDMAGVVMYWQARIRR